LGADPLCRTDFDRHVIAGIHIAAIFHRPSFLGTGSDRDGTIKRRDVDISRTLVDLVRISVEVPEQMEKRARDFLAQSRETLVGNDHTFARIDRSLSDSLADAHAVQFEN